MTVKSGKDGKVLIGESELASITAWRLSMRSNNPAHASSATGGAKTRIAGVRDASGIIRFKLDFDDPIDIAFEPGDSATLHLHLDSSHYYSVPAIIDAIDLDDVDIDDGDTIGGLMRFSATGPISPPEYEVDLPEDEE